MDAGTFSLVPIDVARDKRLTLEQTRVLIALFSFRNRVTDTVWPSRVAISERTGMHISNISQATSALVELGWISKVGEGGFSKSTRYTLCAPDLETVARSTTVAESTTVARSATATIADSATTTVAERATRKEQTNEHTNEQTKVVPRTRSTAPAAPDDVPVQVWADWLQLRKAKKAPVTATVINGARAEAVKAGMTFGDFLAVWCRRGSQGLEAAWLNPEERSQGRSPPPESFRERDARLAAEKVKAWTGGLCHDRRALGEDRPPLPFERGYVKPADTIEGEAHEQHRIAG